MPPLLPIPAESGLAGAPMPNEAAMTANANMADQPEEPTVAGPATPNVEPEPHESIARHILDALGGSDKSNPMGWAKSIIAGGLAGAANVGEVHGGQGFLAGAGRAQQGIALQKRQAALDQQRVQQQQFENQEKLKADARAERELANSSDRTKAEIALHNANTLAAIHSDQRAQALAPFMEAEQKAKLTQLQNAQDESRVNLKKVLIESGMSPKDAEESITSYENAPSGAAQDIASGSMLLTHNGETAKQEEDGVGVHASSNAQSLWDTKIKKDTQVLSGYQYDEKKGFVPQYTTVSAGTSVGTIVAMHDAAHDYLQQQQKQLTDTAELKIKKAQLEHEQASTAREGAQTNLTNLQAKQYLSDNTPNALGDVGGTDPATGAALSPKEASKRYDSFNQKVLEPLQTSVEKSFKMSQQAYSEYQAAKGNLPTGAQSMLMLSNHLSTTFGNVKGARVTKDMIQEHLGARGVSDAALVAVQRLTNGDVLSPDQWKAFNELIGQSREFSYDGAIDNARSMGIGKSIQAWLPKAPAAGTKIDPSTARIYLYAAHGDPKKALDAAKAVGWGVQ